VAIYGPVLSGSGGAREIAELLYLVLRDLGVEQVDVFAAGSLDGGRFLGHPVRDVTMLRPEEYDRVVVAFLDDAVGACRDLHQRGVAPEKLVTLFNNGRTFAS
jgi:hypothetical protein